MALIPLQDLVNTVELPIGVMGLIGVLMLPLGAFGVHWVTARRSWTHGLTRPTLVAYLFLGWIVALVIPVFGNYQLTHRLPGAAELGTALILAMLIGPYIALALAYMVGRIG